MSTDAAYHFPHDVLQTAIEAATTINKGKKDLLLFFRAVGTPPALMRDLDARVLADPKAISKMEISRTIVERLNAGGDPLLEQRRNLLRRISAFEDFSGCWPNERDKAEASVRRLRELVNARDTVTRLENERKQREIAARREREAALAAEIERKSKAKADVMAAFRSVCLERNPHVRGKRAESVVAEMFRMEDLLIAEDFVRREEDTGVALEQIDGAIHIGSELIVVELKWWKGPLGPGETAEWLVRVFNRQASGLLISATPLTPGAHDQCAKTLATKRIAVVTLAQFVSAVEAGVRLKELVPKLLSVAQLRMDPTAWPSD